MKKGLLWTGFLYLIVSCGNVDQQMFQGKSNTQATLSHGDAFLSSGTYHNCLLYDGQINCWGNNADKQSLVPFSFQKPLKVMAKAYETCVIDGVLGLKCWGDRPTFDDKSGELIGPIAIASTGYNNCALDQEGIKCWGNSYSEPMMQPPKLSDAIDIVGGTFHYCALRRSGLVACWGNNSAHQLDVPPGLTGVRKISTEGWHTCALTQGDEVKCWGGDKDKATEVPSDLGPVEDIAVGGFHTCALTKQGKVRCWGRNNHGQADEVSLSGILGLAAGWTHTCALMQKKMYCWGNNEFGQLGRDLSHLSEHIKSGMIKAPN